MAKLPSTSETAIAITFLVINLSTLLRQVFWAFFCAFFEKEQIFSCFLPFAINKSYIFSELSQQKLIFSIGLNNQLSFSCCPLTFSASPS
jgi:hypothetical protein